MVFIFYVLVNVFLILYFFRFQKKNLFPLEIFASWIVSSIIFQNYSALFYMNLNYFYIPDVLSLELAHLLNRTVLIPVITLIFLNQYVKLDSLKKKIVSLIVIELFLALSEWSEHAAGILVHRDWKMEWSFVFWMLYIAVSILFLKYFRKKLIKEVHP